MKYLKEIAIYILLVLFSWIVVVGFVKLITLCFGWSFTWLTATGVWLTLALVRWFINPAREHKD